MPSEIPPNPYGADLGDREPLDALGHTPGKIQALVNSWTDVQFERSYAPGKWTARQILVHLAQTELALTTRARFALTEDGYTAQAFSQGVWMPIDDRTSAKVALDAYVSLRRMNLEMWRRLTPDQRARRFSHPEYGTLTVWWIAAQMAGHDIHHLKQLASIS
jgi:DinB superfamily